jgi:hypothetical protein
MLYATFKCFHVPQSCPRLPPEARVPKVEYRWCSICGFAPPNALTHGANLILGEYFIDKWKV